MSSKSPNKEIKVQEDYTIEIGDVVIEYIKREDLIKLRDTINKLIGDDKLTAWPSVGSVYRGIANSPDPNWGTVTWDDKTAPMKLSNIKLYEYDSDSQNKTSSDSAGL